MYATITQKLFETKTSYDVVYPVKKEIENQLEDLLLDTTLEDILHPPCDVKTKCLHPRLFHGRKQDINNDFQSVNTWRTVTKPMSCRLLQFILLMHPAVDCCLTAQRFLLSHALPDDNCEIPESSGEEAINLQPGVKRAK